MMEPIQDTTLQLGYRVWQVQPPRPSLMVVIKGTFLIQKGAPCILADEQEPCGGDVHHEDDEDLSLRAENDFAILKPRGECFVVGSCFVAREKTATQMQAGFRIGAVQKGFFVFGDRYWESSVRSKPSEPRPFTQMPLCRERAFGGPKHPTNPWGVGFKGFARNEGCQLPNIERSGALVTSPRSRPEPVVTSPIPMNDRSRLKLAGTYDGRYQRSRWPYLPEDFDWEFFLSAPEDQRIRGYWKDDEKLMLMNMHRQHSRVETSLPGLRPRVFLHRMPAENMTDFTEIALALDTITVDTDREIVLCTWRGLQPVETEDLDEVAYLFLTQEEPGQERGVNDIYARYLQRKREEADEEELPEDPLEEAKTTIYQGGLGLQPSDTVVQSMNPDLESAAADKKLAQALAQLPPEPEPSTPPSPRQLEETLRAAPFEVPLELYASLDDLPDGTVEQPLPEPEPDISARDRFLHMLRTARPFDGVVFENADLSGLDLRGENLSGLILVSSALKGCDLRGANLIEVQLSGCDLRDANFEKADLSNADLTGCRATGARFHAANIEEMTADEGQFEGCDFSRAQGPRCSFVEADVRRANFGEAMLTGADFGATNAAEAHFSRATLDEASFEKAQANDACFDGASLFSLRAAEGASFARCRLRGVQAAGSFWDDADLQDADFTASDLSGAFFSGAQLFRAVLDHCDMAGGTLTKAQAAHTSFKTVNLFEADLQEADLSFADFRGANLFGAETWKAKLDGVQLELANIKRTKLGVLQT